MNLMIRQKVSLDLNYCRCLEIMDRYFDFILFYRLEVDMKFCTTSNLNPSVLLCLGIKIHLE